MMESAYFGTALTLPVDGAWTGRGSGASFPSDK